VDDYETRVWDAALELIEAKNKLYSHVPKLHRALGGVGGALLVAAVSANPIGIAVGAAVGIAAVAHRFGTDYTDFNNSLNSFWDTVVEPFMDDEFYSERLVAPETITFVSKEAKELDTFSNYRSPYSQDKGSSTPMMKTLSDASSATEALWEDLSPSLPSPLQAPQALDDIESYSSTRRAVHSKYLEVSDISNDKVKLIKKEEKDGRLVLTFENEAAADQKFTYKLSYTNSNFSPGFSKTISAEITGLTKVLMDGSPWKLTAFAAGKSEFFALNNTGNIACGEKGDLYDHKRRFTGGTFSFTEGTLSSNVSIEYHTYNCDTRSYKLHSNDSPGSQQWKIDLATDKFVLMAGTEEVAWLTPVVSDGGKKITFSGTAKDVEEDEETSPYSFTIEK